MVYLRRFAAIDDESGLRPILDVSLWRSDPTLRAKCWHPGGS